MLAEQSGWDGFFVWEPTWGNDAWVMLTAAAMRTTTIRLGTMLTPLPKRKPWEVASQSLTLDNLSGGRVILSVGLGAPDDRFYIFEDDPGRKVRAERLDEGLEMLEHLWRGQPFSYDGVHFHARRPESMIPPPSRQQPRIKTWVVGMWPAPKSMRRAARWDGWLPNYRLPEGTGRPNKEQLAEAVTWLRRERERNGLTMEGYDIVAEGTTSPGPAGILEVREWEAAGATWWIDANWELEESSWRDESRQRLRAGPPRS